MGASKVTLTIAFAVGFLLLSVAEGGSNKKTGGSSLGDPSPAIKSAMKSTLRSLDKELNRLFSVQHMSKLEISKLITKSLAAVEKQLDGYSLPRSIGWRLRRRFYRKEIGKAMKVLGSWFKVQKNRKLEQIAVKKIKKATAAVGSISCGKDLKCRKSMDQIPKTVMLTLKSLVRQRARLVNGNPRNIKGLRKILGSFLKSFLLDTSRKVKKTISDAIRHVSANLNRIRYSKTQLDRISNGVNRWRHQTSKNVLSRLKGKYRRSKSRKLSSLVKSIKSFLGLPTSHTSYMMKRLRRRILSVIKKGLLRLANESDEKKQQKIVAQTQKQVRTLLKSFISLPPKARLSLGTIQTGIRDLLSYRGSNSVLKGTFQVSKDNALPLLTRWKKYADKYRNNIVKYAKDLKKLLKVVKKIIKIKKAFDQRKKNTIKNLRSLLLRMANDEDKYQIEVKKQTNSILRTLEKEGYNNRRKSNSEKVNKKGTQAQNSVNHNTGKNSEKVNKKGTQAQKSVNHNTGKNSEKMNEKGTQAQKSVNHNTGKNSEKVNVKGTQAQNSVNHNTGKNSEKMNEKGTQAQKSVNHNTGKNSEKVIVIKEEQPGHIKKTLLKELMKENQAHSNGKQEAELVEDINELIEDLARGIFSAVIGNPTKAIQPTVIKNSQRVVKNDVHPVLEDDFIEVESTVKAGARDVKLEIKNI